MWRKLSLALFLGIVAGIAAEVPYEEVKTEEGLYTLELAGMGFAYEDSELDNSHTFMVKVLTRVHEMESVETKKGSIPVRQKVLGSLSAIRFDYTTYPLELIELSSTYMEAKVYPARVSELGELLKDAEPIGTLKLTLTVLTGLPSGKGSLTINDKEYTVVFYQNESLDGFSKWAFELE